MSLLKQPITTPASASARARRLPSLPNSSSSNLSSSNARRRKGAADARAAATLCPRVVATAASSQDPATTTTTMTEQPPPLPPTAPLALKEWAVTIDALLAGDQVVLLRKGGLLDGKFRVEARDFLLFPTTFHVKDQGLLTTDAEHKFAQALALPEPKTLEGSVPLKCRVRVEAGWSTADGRVVAALSEDPGLHVWGPAFTEARLKWKPGAPMTLALVRAYEFVGRGGGGGAGGGKAGEGVLPVKQRADYYGCFSWARVEPLLLEAGEDVESQGLWRPVLSDEEFARRAALVRQRLAEAGIEAAPVELPS